MIKVQATLEASLAEMPADAVGRTYSATLAAFTNLAGQFDEGEQEQTDDDDASAAKEYMLHRLTSIEQRELHEQMNSSEGGTG